MMRFDDQLLVIPEKTDVERDAVASVWREHGGQVLPLGRFWEPPMLDTAQVRLYGNDTFCLVLAQQLNLELVSPPDDLLIHLNQKWLRRHLQLKTLGQSIEIKFPVFVKSLVPKQFQAKIYRNRVELLDECKGLEKDTLLLVSEIVSFAAEARAFVLEDEVKTCAIYEGIGDVNEASHFVSVFVQENELPRTCVIDVGRLENGQWAVVEANATWGSGLNGCEPLAAAVCIAQATLLSNQNPA